MLTTTPFTDLAAQMTGRVVTPSDPDWDATRQVFNLTTDLRPAAIALPRDVSDVVAAVDHARADGLRVAPQATGHNADALGSLEDTLLVDVRELQEVSIDPGARRVRVGAGVKWERVVSAALRARAGRAPRLVARRRHRRLLAGRRHGLARPQVRPPGEQRHGDRARHGRRARGARRRRARARSLLGASRRQRQLRRRHRDRVRRLPGRGALRGRDVLPLRASRRGPPRLERARPRRCRTR